MSKFGIDLNFNFDSVKLDKLYDDANKSGKANLSSTQNNISTNYNATSASSYNQSSQTQVETLDLSTEVTNTNQQNITNTTPQNMSTTQSANTTVSQNTNNNVNVSTNTTTSQSTSFTQTSNTSKSVNTAGLNNNTTNQSGINSVSANSNNANTPNPTATSNSNNNFNFNSNSTNNNSSNTSVNITNQNSNNSTGFSAGSEAMTEQNNTSTTTTNNNTMTPTSSSSDLDTDIDIDVSMDTTDEDETNDNSNTNVNSPELYTTTSSGTSEVKEVEIQMDEYITNLRSCGITDEDINRILSGQITPEMLIEEIQNDPDGTRRNNITIASYLQAFGLSYTNLKELEEAIAAGGEQAAQLQYIYDYINSIITYNNECIDKYIFNDDFNSNKGYKEQTGTVIQEIYNRHKPYTGTTENDDQEGFLGWLSRLAERQMVYETSTSHNSINGTSNNKEYILGKKDVVDTISYMLNGSLISGNVYNCGGNLVFLESYDLVLQHYFDWASVVNEQEKDVFNYIYNTQGYEAAYDYLNSLSDVLDSRWLAKKTEEDQAFAEEHPIIASVASIVVTPIEGLAAVSYSLNALLQGEKIRRAGVYSSGDIWRAQVGQSIAEDYGEEWAFIYNTAMSMADTATLVALSYATGGMANLVLSATIMGSRAYVSTLNDALDRGLSDGAAVTLAFSSAIVETAMESWSVGHLLNLENALGSTTSKIVTKIANKISNPTLASLATKSTYVILSATSQGLCEGEEELATEIVNFVADELISGDLSNHTLTMNNYINQGYTEEEAWRLACKDFKKQLEQAFLGGAVSGFCFGSFSGIKTTHQVSKNIAANITADFEGTKAQAFAKIIEANTVQQQDNQEPQEQVLQSNIAEEIKITDNIQEQVQESIPQFSSEDVTALMANATVANFEDRLDFEKLYSVFHKKYDSKIGSANVDQMLSEFKIIKQDHWNEVCAEHGLSGRDILGFVDKQSNLYLPENANMHTAVHEGMHKFSEFLKKFITLKDGTTRKVTGIREFFDDGTDSNIANESLTDYLASKIYDGVIYESMYSSTNVRLWERIDNLLTVKYGENQDVLFEAYNANSADTIRVIFDELCGAGTYNRFVKTMSFWYAKGAELNSIVEQLEKAVKPKSIFSRIKDSLKLKTKPTSQIQIDNYTDLENTAPINTTTTQEQFDNSLYISQTYNIQQVMYDVENAIQSYLQKYNCSRKDVLGLINLITKTGDFSLMTSSGNARYILQQYGLTDLSQALYYMQQTNPENQLTTLEQAIIDVRYALKSLEKQGYSNEEAIRKIWNFNVMVDNKVSTVLKQYDITQIQMALQHIVGNVNQQQNNINNTNYYQQNTLSKRVAQAVCDVEFAIQAYIEKHNKSRQYVINAIQTLINTRDFSKMTRYNNARQLLQQYSFGELQQAINYMQEGQVTSELKQPSIKMPKLAQITNIDQYYSNIFQVTSTMQNPINDYSVLKKLYSIRENYYHNLVNAVNDGYRRTMPSADRINNYRTKFNSNNYRIEQQANAFTHVISRGFNLSDVSHRLYLNMDFNDTLDFVQQFAEKCESRNIPFYFKTAPLGAYSEQDIHPGAFTRDESIVIYGGDNHIVDYINICNEVMRETPTLQAIKPPILTGVINGYLGYGEEPNNATQNNQYLKQSIGVSPSKRFSFNSLRAYLLEIAYNRVSNNYYNSEQEQLNAFYWEIIRLCESFGVNTNQFFLNN